MTAVRRLTMILCLFAVSLSAQTGSKPQARPSGTVPTNITADRDANSTRALRLSLEQAIGNAVTKNLGVELQHYDYRMSGQDLRAQYGPFDFFTTADILRVSDENPVTSPFFTSAGNSTVFNFGLNQLLATGGTYRVGFNNSRSESVGGGTFVNPAYRSNLGFEFNQPLLRNFGVDTTRRGINIARNTLGINREAFRNVLINTAVSVEQSYLDLVFARQFLEVAKESLFLAQDQSRITQIRIDVGASAPLDILQPRVAVATREEELITAQALVRDAEDRLRQLMNLDMTEWDRPIIPTDSVGYQPLDVDTDAAVARALEARPEIRQLKLGTQSREIIHRYARNQTLPKLDLVASYGAAGLGGRSAEIDPVTGQPTGRIATTDYPEAVSQVFGNDFPSWTFGFSVGVPVTNVGARAEARRAELDLRKAETDEKSLRQIITVDVRKGIRDVDTASKQITATRAARDAAEKNLDAERKRFENGMTTNFNVLQIQQQLSDARSRELQAVVFYNKALANYHRAVGDLLDQRGIVVDVEEFESPGSRFEDVRWLNYGNYARTK